MPVDPRDPLAVAGSDRRAAEAADMLDHRRELVVREHRDVAEQVMKQSGSSR